MSEAPPVLPAHHVRGDGQRHTFVLVHGSWQAGWAWDEVRGRLEADGHRVLAPTLPGHEAGAEDRAGITHDDYVDAVLRVLDDSGGTAWSWSGTASAASSSARSPTDARTGWRCWCTARRSCSRTARPPPT